MRLLLLAPRKIAGGYLPLLLLLLAALVHEIRTECENCQNDTVLPLSFKDLVPEHYDKLVSPTENGNPVVVKVKISVLNMQYVDEVKQAFSADIFLHQFWTDNRVRIPPSYKGDRMVLDGKWRTQLWTPDTFFKNSLDGKVNDIIIPYSYVTLNRKSELFFAVRVSLKLSCEMNLAAYPHDVQECDITVMSLTYTNDTVELVWKDFELTKSLFLAQYYVSNSSKEICTKKYKIGTFSCLQGKIKLARRLGYFLINKYIPCILIVCMSFVTFWVPAEAYPARVTLSVTSLLTIVTQQYQSSMPSVSYVVALNIWMLSCIGFVFASLLEYAFVIALMNQRGTTMCPFHKFKKFFQRAHNDTDSGLDKSPRSEAPHQPTEMQKRKITHLTVDRASRVAFPSLFIIFVFSYFMVFSRW